MTHGYTEETEHYLKRLRRIEGQLRGLQRTPIALMSSLKSLQCSPLWTPSH